MARAHLTQHYEQLLGLPPPWRIEEVELDHEAREVRIRVTRRNGRRLRCPKCQQACGIHDHRERRWRHLDTMQYQTILIAAVPRVRCDTHGVRQVAVPWADEGSRFTALFEALVIDWLHEASFLAVARRLRMTWDQVAGVQKRAVERGLARRELQLPSQIGVDETSFQKPMSTSRSSTTRRRRSCCTWRMTVGRSPSRATSRRWVPRAARSWSAS